MGELGPGDVVDGRYEVLGSLGEGAWCRVYRAWQRGLDREVALKVPTGRLLGEPTGLARFFREVLVASRLVHPNVVEVFDMKKAASPPYFSMQLVSGGDLRTGFARGMATERSLRVLAGVARALGAAGAAGVVHRDLKPANVLISEEGEAKVTDWGLSRILDGDTRLTATGNVPGTPMYMAPEGLGGGEVGPPADWYALGVMTAEAVMVGAGWGAREVLATKATHMQGKFPRLDELVPGVSPELARLVEGLLQADPSARPSDADEVAAVLTRAATGVTRAPEATPPFQPHPPPPSAQSTADEFPADGPPASLGGRRPVLAAALVTLGLTLVAAWYALGGPDASAPLVLRRARLVDPRRLELRFEGGGPSASLEVVVRGSGGKVSPPVAVSLTDSDGAKRRVRTVEVLLQAPVVDDAEVSVIRDGAEVAGVAAVSGRPLADEVLSPVRALAGERLARLLTALDAVRRQGGDARPTAAGLLAGEGLGQTWQAAARRVLPDLVGPTAPPWLVRDLLPLRMIETQLADCPWPHLAPLLGQLQERAWSATPPPGFVILGSCVTRVSVADVSGSGKPRKTFRWLMDQAEIARSRPLRSTAVTAGLLSDQMATIWSVLSPATTVSLSLRELAQVPAEAELRLQLNLIHLCREAYLEVEVNGHGEVVLMNWGQGEGVMTTPEGWSFPVDRSWLVEGKNRVRVRALCLPGLRPYAAAGLVEVRVLRGSR